MIGPLPAPQIWNNLALRSRVIKSKEQSNLKMFLFGKFWIMNGFNVIHLFDLKITYLFTAIVVF